MHLYICSNNRENKMTKFISFLQLKGGAGKSTLSANLCGFLLEQGHTVLAVDSDMPQGTLAAWASMYEHPKFKCLTAADPQQLITILKHANGHFDFVVIDSPPRMAEMMTAILYVSDLVLLPMAATSPDIWAVSDMAGIINKTLKAQDKKVKIRVVWNKYKDTKKMQETREDALSIFGYKEIPVPISNFIAYAEVMGMGRHALDYNHAKAKSQFTDFGNAVLTALNEKD